MDERTMRFRVGVFVLATLFLLAVLSILFAGFPSLLKRHSSFTILLDDAKGVGPGTPVRRAGVRIGEVRNIELDDATGKVKLGIAVEREHPPRQGDQAALTHGLLGGDAAIDFLPPPVGAPPAERAALEPGAVLTGIERPDALAMLQQTAELVPSTRETLNEMRKSLQRFERLAAPSEEAIKEFRDLAKSTREAVPELRRTNDEILVAARNWGRLGERVDVLLQTNQDKLVKALDNFTETVNRVANVFNDENQRQLAATLKNVRAGSDNLESISRNTDELLKESRQTIRRVNDSVTRADEVLGNLQQATKPMAERSGRVMQNLDESTDRLNRTLAQAQEFLRNLNQGQGSLRSFLNDPALYNNLNDAACMLTRILPRFDRILRDAEVFADKIARHPESLGLGGVVSPSSGLKTAPTSNYRGPGH